MAEFPWFKMYPAAMLGDTQHLSNEEFGAYHRMLYAAWMSRDCVLPDDDERLARIARMSPQKWRRSGPTLREFWQSDGHGCLVQKRLSSERFSARAISANNSRAGKASALKRKEAASTVVEFPLNERTNERSTKRSTYKSTELDLRTSDSLSHSGSRAQGNGSANASTASERETAPAAVAKSSKEASKGKPHGPKRPNAFSDEI